MTVTSDELTRRIRHILRKANLQKTTKRNVRDKLEEDLNKDLSSRKREVNDLIDEVMNEFEHEDEEDEEPIQVFSLSHNYVNV